MKLRQTCSGSTTGSLDEVANSRQPDYCCFPIAMLVGALLLFVAGSCMLDIVTAAKQQLIGFGKGVALAMTAEEMKKNYWFNNPIIQTNYTADPAPMVYNGRVYLYTTHDEDGATWFTMNEWRCYSSADMVNWTDHGSPLHYTDFEWARGDAWAGQCIERDGKFYFYVPISKKGGWNAVGVAVADSPTGPFEDPLGHPLVETGTGDIDPTVFIDDDGQAYLYWGNPYLWYVKLNEDMISYDQEVGIVQVELTPEGFGLREGGDPKRPTLYEEGPWFYKRNGLYYMVYAASGIPENIAYSTSPSPTGPWTFRGIIMPTQGTSFTNHPGICDFKGRSYFFYHNGALPGGGGFTRSVCVEEFTYNPDGTFPTINMTTEGVAPVDNLDPYVRNEAETIAWSYGVRTEPCSQGGMNVCNIDDGDYIKVRSVDFGDQGAISFAASVSSVSAGGVIELHLDSPHGQLIGTLEVPNTGGLDSWQLVRSEVVNAHGIHDLFFVFKGRDATKSDLFKFDYWQFESAASARE
jgi:arabinoxylan arabinofuranohydrolase